ncbi:MAG: NADH/ubiquinone/plastoquinone [Intrasporangium sp.]|uniref:NADH-quinone oxidoreductase subunit N n=1 Tax=Intrasporangium sp. TaxID=1925024 RepID=UPI002647A503|nr:proton-conducting transporter membrane subunit [Intrasporangium sp.]MDN5794623.1 NADH/ubiquinone/plastoquinone [Intrasporangium sp.]
MTGLAIDVVTLLPALIPLAGVLVVLVADLVVPRLRGLPYAVAAVASLGAAGAAIPGVAAGAGTVRTTFCLSAGWFSPGGGSFSYTPGEASPYTSAMAASECLWRAGALGSSLQLGAGLAAAVCLALAWPVARARPAESTREPIEAILFLTALTGTVVVAASRDIGTWLVALELATLPVIALVALTGTRAALAGAMQLLVTSLVSFALLAVGAALWFLATGAPFFSPDAALAAGQVPAGTVAAAAPAPSVALLSLSLVLVLAGLGFKLSLVPFHAWTPTAYAGSTPAVATFLATVSKIGALAALLVLVQALSGLGTPGLLAVAVLSAVTMTLGNVMALRQDDVVRLLAWSTVAQAGWVILPLVSISALGQRSAGIYLLTYVAATLVAFAVVARTVQEVGARGRGMAAYAGLWLRSPWRAGALALALTSLAGLPPGVIGLVGKIVAFRPVIVEGWVWLALVAAGNAVLGVAVYLRWLRPVLNPSEAETGSAPVEPAAAGQAGPSAVLAGRRLAITVALVASVLVLLAVSIQPQLLLGLFGT